MTPASLRHRLLNWPWIPELLAEMSPLSRMDGTEPPFLLLHGTRDPSVPYEKSEEFAAALADAGAEAELVLFEAPHAFILQPVTCPVMAASLGAIETFLATQSEAGEALEATAAEEAVSKGGL